MKKFITSAVVVLMASSALFFNSCNCGGNAPAPRTVSDSLSYAYGVGMASQIMQSLESMPVEVDATLFAKAFAMVINGKDDKLAITPEEAYQVFQTSLMTLMAKVATDNKKQAADFLAENAKNENVKTTASGLQYEVLVEGEGKKPAANDRVKVHYHGTLLDGTVFDSSVDRGEPAEFGLYQVIPGWTEGLQLMSVGSKYRLYIPSELAYGDNGAGDVIKPGEMLIFEVELLDIL